MVVAIERIRDGGHFELPAVVAKDVSREFFEDFLAAHDERMGVRLEYRDSSIVVYECPVSVIHETVQSAVYDAIRAALGFRAFSFRGGAPSCKIGCSSRQADASLTPRTKPNPGIGVAAAADAKGFAYPNVVVEVAVSQTWADVGSKAEARIGPHTTVQQAIIVQVGDARGAGARVLRVYSYIRGVANPAQDINLSLPAPADAVSGSPVMQLHVPLACLFYEAAGGVPAGMADPLDVDMFCVQQMAADATP